MVYLSNSEQDTKKIAEVFAKQVNRGDVICFFGEMGAGKTAFTRYLAAAMGVKSRVSSPTFAIVNQYNGIYPIYHFDMYRVDSEDSLYSTGFYDYLDGEGVLIIEWSENIIEYLPERYKKIEITKTSEENQRKIEISVKGDGV